MTSLAIRSYRIYFRDSLNVLSQPHEVNLGSDEEAGALAQSMLDEHPKRLCAEIWDRARLVCIIRRDAAELPYRGAASGPSQPERRG